MKVVVVGAGIMGALTGFRLAQRGAAVTIIEARQPAAAASGASFGWINASFFLDHEHFRLRQAGIAALRRLASELATAAVRWQGALCWEKEGAEMDAQYQELRALGYSVRMLDRDEFCELEPSVAAPARALLFKDEGAVDLPQLIDDALSAAGSLGAQVLSGITVTGVKASDDRVCGVCWSGGEFSADKVVLTAGVHMQALLARSRIALPMLDRPGLLLRSAPLPPLLAHILVTPDGEVRQNPAGCILAPTVAAHQSDDTEKITQDPRRLAGRRAEQISTLLGRKVRWQQVSLAHRPVPEDGYPVIGATGPEGLHVAVMHSGATLAALAAEITADEVMEGSAGNDMAALIAGYRPQRFTG